jgi:hypothetical protein
VEEREVVGNAPCANDDVYGLANGDSPLAQEAVIVGGADGQRLPGETDVFQGTKNPLDSPVLLFIPDVLQHFGNDKVAGHHFLPDEGGSQQCGLGRFALRKIIYPD